MLSALLDIVIPVFAVAGLGALYGRLRGGAELGYMVIPPKNRGAHK